jgi:hypothetical protein
MFASYYTDFYVQCGVDAVFDMYSSFQGLRILELTSYPTFSTTLHLRSPRCSLKVRRRELVSCRCRYRHYISIQDRSSKYSSLFSPRLPQKIRTPSFQTRKSRPSCDSTREMILDSTLNKQSNIESSQRCWAESYPLSSAVFP